MLRKLCKISGGTILVLGMALTCRAQGTTGSISGTVKDSTGAVLPGATVVLRQEETGISRTVQADAAGRYTASALAVGNYQVTTNLEGFQTEVRTGIVLTIGRQAIVDFTLSVGAVAQTVNVTAEAPLVETTQSAVSTLVSSTTINELPLNGRNLAMLVLLQPGVTETVNPSTAVHRGWGTQINISGARSDENQYLLDGTVINDFRGSPPVGPNGILYGAGAIQEFQVQTSNFSAQFGQAQGGVFNSLSKSGTNAFHGEVFEFLRNNAVDARNFFDLKGLPPFRRNQFGAGVGGPIVKDKTFFHASYEGLRSVRTTTARPSVPGLLLRQGIFPDGSRVEISSIAASIIPYWPLPTPGGRTFSDGTAEYIVATPTRVGSNFGQARVDHHVSEKDSFFGRLTLSQINQSNVLSTPGYTQFDDNFNRWATVSETHIFSPRDLNTFTFGFNRVGNKEISSYPDLPALQFFPKAISPWPGNFSVTGIGMSFSLGLYNAAGYYNISNRFEVIDNVTLTRGNHSIQFGGRYTRLQLQYQFPNTNNGSYSFRTFRGFLLNQPSQLGQFRGVPINLTDMVRGDRTRLVALYVQDDWRVSPRLTLNLGVRYDWNAIPTEVNGKMINFRTLLPGQRLPEDGVYVQGDPVIGSNPTNKNFAPRLGFAWTPWQNRSTTVRGGVGLFYSLIDLRWTAIAGDRDGFLAKGVAIATPSHFPDALAEIAAENTPQVDHILYDGLRTPRSWQWNLNVQQQFGASTVLSVGYTGNKGLNLNSNFNVNQPDTSYVDGILTAPLNGKRKNPNFEIFFTEATNVSSWYNGLTVNLMRRLAAGLQFQLAYSFSKAMAHSESSGSRASVTSDVTNGTLIDVGHLGIEWGLTSWDIRNVVKFNYVYQLPWGAGRPWMNNNRVVSRMLGGWQVSGIVTLKDGSPYTYSVATASVLSAMTYGATRPVAKVGNPVGGIILGKPNEMCEGSSCLRYYDPNSFTYPGTRQLGNLGRNTGIGPGIATWDVGLQKSFSLRENLDLQFRAEGFNLLNRANFGRPGQSVFNSVGAVQGSAGVINDTTTDNRTFQFGLKLGF